MMLNNSYGQYRQVQVQTASQGSLILMLFDGALKKLNSAKLAIEKCQIEAADRNLKAAQDIFSELMITLNLDAGVVAQNLYTVYEYCHYRLVQANVKKDIAMVEEVIGHVVVFRQTWDQVIRKAGANSSAPHQGSSLDIAR